MAEMNIQRMLDHANNMFGRLDPEIRARLQAVADSPTQETWDNAFSIILRDGTGFGLGLTLWQAVIAVDPTFPRVGPTRRRGKQATPWERVPDQFTILRALRMVME